MARRLPRTTLALSAVVLVGYTETGCGVGSSASQDSIGSSGVDEEILSLLDEYPCRARAERGGVAGCTGHFTQRAGKLRWEYRTDDWMEPTQWVPMSVHIMYQDESEGWVRRETLVDEQGEFNFSDVPKGPVYFQSGLGAELSDAREVDLRWFNILLPQPSLDPEAVAVQAELSGATHEFHQLALYCQGTGLMAHLALRDSSKEGRATSDTLVYEGSIPGELARAVDLAALDNCHVGPRGTSTHSPEAHEFIARVDEAVYDPDAKQLELELEFESAPADLELTLDWNYESLREHFADLRTGRKLHGGVTVMSQPDESESLSPTYRISLVELAGLEIDADTRNEIHVRRRSSDDLTFVQVSAAYLDELDEQGNSLTALMGASYRSFVVLEGGVDSVSLQNPVPLDFASGFELNGEPIDLSDSAPQLAQGPDNLLTWETPPPGVWTTLSMFAVPPGIGFSWGFTEAHEAPIPYELLAMEGSVKVTITFTNCGRPLNFIWREGTRCESNSVSLNLQLPK